MAKGNKPFDLAGIVKSRFVERLRMRPGDLLDHPGQDGDHSDQQAATMAGVLREVGQVDTLKAYHSQRAGGALVCTDGHLRRSLDPDLLWDVDILDLTDAEADYMLATFDRVGAMKTADKAAEDALLSTVRSNEAAVIAMLEQEKRAVYGFLENQRDDDPEPAERSQSQRAQFSLAIVLTASEHKAWQAYKSKLGKSDDKAAFMALWSRNG